jgi:hypothetical protein
MNKKDIVKIIFIFMIAILGTVGITFGLLVDQTEVKTNVFVPGVLTASILENGSIVSGNVSALSLDDTTIEKRIQVKNILNPHEVDAYIRVVLVPVFRTDEGTLSADMLLAPDGNNIEISAPGGGSITLQLIDGWQDNWIFNNGYFYYKYVVPPGQNTAILLNSIAASDSSLWDTFCLEALSDAVQSECGAAYEAWGSIANQLEL